MAQKDPETLVEWIAHMCLRPGMYFVGAPDFREVRATYLFMWVEGWLTARGHKDPDWASFREFAYSKRPDLRPSTLWFGDELARRLGGPTAHQDAIEQIRVWANEWLIEHGPGARG